MEIRLTPKLKSLLLLFLILFICTVPNVFAYRPFIFTDAAVAALKEWEIEVGLFSMTHDRGINKIFVPSLKFNYGILKNWELVGEFDLQVFKQGEDRNRELTDPAFFIKGVLREGILQDKKGISFVVELGVLLPSTVEGERKAGLEGIVVITGKLSDLVFHINLGGEFDRDRFAPHGLWGMILEYPLTERLQLVGEINGFSQNKKPSEYSGLIGFIYDAGGFDVDFGIRKGFSNAASDWALTTGMTISF